MFAVKASGCGYMTKEPQLQNGMDRLRTPRRRFLLSGTAVTAAAIAGSAIAQPATPQSSGPMRAGRGTDLRGKFAVVTGACARYRPCYCGRNGA